MSKTPVSILQEMMVKKQKTPDYQLIHNGGGTHDNIFTYKVLCDGLSATGTGRSKKDAKHEAAKAMLETIAAHKAYPQLPPPEKKSPAKVPLPAVVPTYPKTPPNVPFMNAVGALKALCGERELQEPEYHQISDVGPPHLRVFTVQCVVANFKEEAAATTKKQAKHEAARRMLDKVASLIDSSFDDDSEEDEEMKAHNEEMKAQKEAIEAQDEQIKSILPTFSKLYASRKVNLGLTVAKCHKTFRDNHPLEVRQQVIETVSSSLQKCKTCDSDVANVCNDVLLEITEALQPLNVHISNTSLCANTDDCCLEAVEINCVPRLVSIGIGKVKEEALLCGIEKLISRLIILLQ